MSDDCNYELTKTYADTIHQSQCNPCRAEAWKNHPTHNIMIGTIPGGFKDTRGDARYDFQKNFDKGLDAYKKARDEGLAPKATSVAAVEASHREVKSQQRALKKLKKMGVDGSELAVAKGVN